MIRRLIDSGLRIGDIVRLRPCLTSEGELNGCEDAQLVLRDQMERLQGSIAREGRRSVLADQGCL